MFRRAAMSADACVLMRAQSSSCPVANEAASDLRQSQDHDRKLREHEIRVKPSRQKSGRAAVGIALPKKNVLPSAQIFSMASCSTWR